jgi:hypothetical protein
MLLPPVNPSFPQIAMLFPTTNLLPPTISRTFFKALRRLLPLLNLALASFPTTDKLPLLFSRKGAPPCNNATITQTHVQATKPPPYKMF